MSEAELRLVKAAKNCTIYSIQFLSEDESEFERFYAKFRDESVYNEDFERLLNIIGRIADFGAFERFFRPEGKMSDYCLRLSDKILILGNGGVKATPTYNEDDTLKGYVITLQNFDKLITEGVKNGSILVTENTIETKNTFDI